MVILHIHIFAAVELSASAAGAKYSGYRIWHDNIHAIAIATCQSLVLMESIYMQVIFKQSIVCRENCEVL